MKQIIIIMSLLIGGAQLVLADTFYSPIDDEYSYSTQDIPNFQDDDSSISDLFGMNEFDKHIASDLIVGGPGMIVNSDNEKEIPLGSGFCVLILLSVMYVLAISIRYRMKAGKLNI